MMTGKSSNHPARILLLSLIAGCVALCGIQPLLAAPPATAAKSIDSRSMKEARKVAADRRRRLLFNDDGGGVTKRLTSPTAQAILDDCFSQVAGTHVDTILYCTKSSGFSLFTHFTKAGQVFTTREDIFANNQMEALVEAGIDPLQVMIDFCKQHNIEMFWSMRMNDTHDGSRTSYAPVLFRVNKLKVEHPEYLIGVPGKRPKHGAWSAVDYARPEIRELAFRYFEEVCRNYDVDGIELDFSRHPVFFKSTSRGQHATDEDRAMMTDLLRRIRTMADEVGQQRGRPILIAARVPGSVEYSRAIGLDIENWLASDLLDLFIPSNHVNDWDYSVALARKHGVKVYPSLDESRAGDEIGKALRITPLAYRARAAEVWATGADGVYLYNALGPETSIWRELGDPKVLAKLDKDYFASPRGIVNSAGGNLPLEPFLKIETLNPKNPKTLKPGKMATAQMNVGEDLIAVGPVKLKLRLRFDPPLDPALIRVAINDQPLELLHADNDWLDYTPPPQAVRCGSNQVNLTLSSEATAPVKWIDLMLEVRHEKN
jgi:hypothetical protein